jgi:hypothetical protein
VHSQPRSQSLTDRVAQLEAMIEGLVRERDEARAQAIVESAGARKPRAGHRRQPASHRKNSHLSIVRGIAAIAAGVGAAFAVALLTGTLSPAPASYRNVIPPQAQSGARHVHALPHASRRGGAAHASYSKP